MLSTKLAALARSVAVKAAPALASERAFGDQLLHARRDRRRRSSRRSPSTTSSPTRSSSASGPIGCPAPSACRCRCPSGSMPVSSSSRTALNRYGNSSRLTTKPGTSGTSTGVFSKSRTAPARASRVSALAALREHQLDQLHLRDGVEHVQADEAVRAPAGLRQALDRQRGGGAREDRLRAEDRVQLAEQAAP